MIEYICNYCGKVFLDYPSQNRRYCSWDCYMEWRRENIKGSLAARWAGGNVTITCEVCGKEFGIKRCRLGEARFCSRECASKTRRTQIEIICEGCGVTFTGFPGRRFCSKSCSDQYLVGERHHKWSGGPPEVICEWCGKTFEGRAHGSDHPRRFCSKTCSGKWASKFLRGSKSHSWRGGQIGLICEQCGATFKVKPSRIGPNRKHKARFCSVECLAQWHSDDFKGENNPCWQGGISPDPYPPEFNEEFKELVRKRDDYRCIICDKSANVVHHINYDKQDTRSENCVVLCRSCHARSNSNRVKWEEYLSTSVQKRAEET